MSHKCTKSVCQVEARMARACTFVTEDALDVLLKWCGKHGWIQPDEAVDEREIFRHKSVPVHQSNLTAHGSGS